MVGRYRSIEEMRSANEAAGQLFFASAPASAAGPWLDGLYASPPDSPRPLMGTVFEPVHDGRYFLRSCSWQSEVARHEGRWISKYQIWLTRENGEVIAVGWPFSTQLEAEGALSAALAAGRLEVLPWPSVVREPVICSSGSRQSRKANLEAIVEGMVESDQELREVGFLAAADLYRVYLGRLYIGEPMQHAAAIELADELRLG